MKFNQLVFFKVGIICFGIVSLANTYGYVLEFGLMPNWGRVSRLASLLFNYALTYFFYWLYKSTPKELTGDELEIYLEHDDEKTEIIK